MAADSLLTEVMPPGAADAGRAAAELTGRTCSSAGRGDCTMGTGRHVHCAAPVATWGCWTVAWGTRTASRGDRMLEGGVGYQERVRWDEETTDVD